MMTTLRPDRVWQHHGLGAVGLCVLLAACGGGGGGAEAPQTSLPAQVSIAASAVVQTATEVVFKPSVAASSGVSFRWNLGDGGNAVTDAAPTHVFARSGNYRVSLVVSDTTGATRSASFDIVVSDQAHVQGLQCSAANAAGWCWSPAMKGNGDKFNNVAFADAALGWASGDAGHVYKTDDAGKTWASKLQLSNDSVVNVAAANAQRVWALTRAGQIYGSMDGGETWRSLPSGLVSIPGKQFSWRMEVFDAHRLQIHTGLDANSTPALWSSDGGENWTALDQTIVARHGQVFWGSASRSEDNGQTFQAYALPTLKTNERYKSLSVADARTAVWTVEHVLHASSASTVAIVRTIDGGQSWLRREMPAGGPVWGWRTSNGAIGSQILAASADRLWAASEGRVARSVDGGLSWIWHEIPGLPPGRLGQGTVDPAEPNSFTVISAEGFYGTGPQALLQTVDGGLTWKRQAPDSFGPQRLSVFQRLGAQTLLWGSESGSLFRADDGGTSWTLLAGLGQTAGAVRRIAFWDGQHGLAFRDDGALLSTADSGRSWKIEGDERQDPLKSPSLALQLYGAKGWMLRNGQLHFSSDRGRTWLAQNHKLSSTPAAMHFLDANRGVVIGESNEVLRTSDGGATWRLMGRRDSGSGFIGGELSFSGESNGLLRIGPDRVQFTRDGGASWLAAILPNNVTFYEVKLVDGQNGWAVGSGYDLDGVLYQTRDGGESWTRRELPSRKYTGPFRSISFASPSHGWIVGDGGVIYATQDAGTSWSLQPLHSTRDLTAVHFGVSTTGWIGGAQGEVLMTGTGGN